MTPDLIYDQMIAAGVARKLVFSWLGNPGVGGLNAIRRVTEGAAASLELEEYSHFGMVARYTAGAANLPFFPLRSYFETDLPVANPLIRPIAVAVRRRHGLRGAAAPAGRHDRPRPARRRRRQHPGLGPARLPEGGGLRRRAGHRRRRGARRRGVIRADPNRTIIPGLIVDAVVVEPWGAHPSYVQGAYDRDNRFYRDWDPISRDRPSRPRPGSASGSTTSTAGPPTSRSWARSGWRRSARGRRRPGRSTTGRTDEPPRPSGRLQPRPR